MRNIRSWTPEILAVHARPLCASTHIYQMSPSWMLCLFVRKHDLKNPFMYVRAHAHWPNITQMDLTVVFVIEVVAVIVY